MKLRVLFGLLWPALALAAGSSAFAGGRYSVDEHIRPKFQSPATLNRPRLNSSQINALNLTGGTFQQDIDHFGKLPGQTFAQRYWVDTEYATDPAHAPVLYHICGEGDATQGYFLHDNAINWAQSLHANIVYLEHRYYGQSLPFPDLSTEHLQYLTLGNVIADLASFQKWISAKEGWQGPWISLGGSYSGTLSAIYRQQHPELVVGALASSAPMIAGQGQPEGTQGDVDSLSSTDPSTDSGGRQWVYQACTTFDFWEADGPSIDSNLYYPSNWLCQQLFGNAPVANVNTYNANFDAPFITRGPNAPSHILFTYGSDDVWTNIGLAEQTNNNPNITIQVIQGAGHHYDLNPPSAWDSSAVVQARTEFLTLAGQWIQSAGGKYARLQESGTQIARPRN